MPVNPNIALGVQPVQIADPMAQYGKIIAIQNAQNQNALNQYQLGAAQRGEAREVAKMNALAQAGADETAVANALLKSGDLAGYSAFVKAAEDRKTQKLIQQKTEAELFDASMKQIRNFWGNVSTPEEALAIHDATHKDPIINKRLQALGITEQMGRQQIMDAAKDPASFATFVKKAQLGAEKFMEMNKPTTSVGPTGIVQIPGLGGPAQVVSGTAAAFQMTPAQIAANKIAQGQLAVSQGQLANAQARLAWEKANPGFELKEDADGNFYGINKRTLQATPVMVGGTAPMATPAAPSAGMLGPRVPAPVTQAIPGMPSVLDRPVAAPAVATPSAAPTAGAQLRGKKDIPAKFADTDMQLSGLAGSLKEFKNEVGKQLATGAKFLPTGADTARMQAKYTALLMGVKDLYTLGALAGPDMSIIESQLTNPASWSGKLTSQKGFEEQVKVIEDMLKRSANNLENTYGRQPKATKEALKSLESGLTGASATNPLGLPGL